MCLGSGEPSMHSFRAPVLKVIGGHFGRSCVERFAVLRAAEPRQF